MGENSVERSHAEKQEWVYDINKTNNTHDARSGCLRAHRVCACARVCVCVFVSDAMTYFGEQVTHERS